MRRIKYRYSVKIPLTLRHRRGKLRKHLRFCIKLSISQDGFASYLPIIFWKNPVLCTVKNKTLIAFLDRDDEVLKVQCGRHTGWMRIPLELKKHFIKLDYVISILLSDGVDNH